MIDNQNQNSHNSILKAIGVFGFSQVSKIFISLLSTKLVAIFLGANGIGLIGILNNIVSIISSVTGFGINTVAVRELSLESSQQNKEVFSIKYQIIKKWSLIAGIFGCVLTVFFSKQISIYAFGNSNNYFWFIMLSLNFIITSLSTAQSSLLQSKRMIKEIALASIVSSFFIVFFTIPIYYFFREKAIIPVLLISSSISLFVNIYFSRKIKLISVASISNDELFKQIKPLFKLGFLLSINVIFGQICNFLIRLYFKSVNQNLEILGFYEVGSILLLSYVGLVFGAMSTDFYPRLTSIANDNCKVKSLVNDQIEIGLLIITPLIILFYCLMPIIIATLYTKEFITVILILKFGLLAIIIKSIIWPLSYIILSKGENRLYFKQEIISDILNVSLTIALYYWFGLLGIGLAMLVNYLLYGIYVFYILREKFEFNLRKETSIIVLKTIILGIISCSISLLVDYPIAYYLQFTIFIFATIISYKELNKKTDISNYIQKLKSKFIK